MNNARRQEIAKATAMISEALTILEAVRDDEQDSFDNMPEGLQMSDRGQQSELAAGNLDDAVSALDEALRAAEEAGE